MNSIVCFNCEKEFDAERARCPYCDAPNSTEIGRYPTLGKGWFMAIWVLFILLMIGMFVTMFSN